MAGSQFNVRLPGFTVDIIELIAITYGMSKAQVVMIAIDRLATLVAPQASDPRPARRMRTWAKEHPVPTD